MAFKKRKDSQKEGHVPSAPNKEVKEQEASSFQHPILVSFSMTRKGGGWVTVRLETQGDKVIKTEYSNPDMRNVTFERFRLMVAKELLSV